MRKTYLTENWEYEFNITSLINREWEKIIF
jgi:hypothetical protein